MVEHCDHLPSKENTRDNVRVHLKPYFKDMLIHEITPNKIKEYIRDKQTEGYKDGTIRKQLTPLSASFNHAHKEGRIAPPPIVTMPSPPPAKDIFLTQPQAIELFRATKTPHIKLYIALGLYTGARKSAILDLKWAQVSLEKRLINLNPPGRTQTKKLRPIVPINDDLLFLLKEARSVPRCGEYVVMFGGQKVGNIKKAFARICDMVGLKNVTPHTLRHTFATWLAQEGVSMGRIAKLLGDRETTVERNYAHHSPEYMHANVNVISCNLQSINSRNRTNTSNTAVKRKKVA